MRTFCGGSTNKKGTEGSDANGGLPYARGGSQRREKESPAYSSERNGVSKSIEDRKGEARRGKGKVPSPTALGEGD